MMIVDGIIFGLSIAAGYILSYRYMLGTGASTDQAGIMAGTVSFAITLLSPQIYVFILREGSLIEKFKRKNVMLKSFFVFTFVMILGIIYLPSLNRLFTTAPLYDVYLWGMVLVFSLLTTLLRAILREHLFLPRKLRSASSTKT